MKYQRLKANVFQHLLHLLSQHNPAATPCAGEPMNISRLRRESVLSCAPIWLDAIE